MRTRGAADLRTLLARYVESLRVRNYSVTALDKAALEVGRLVEHLRGRGIRSALSVDEAALLTYLAKRRRARNRRTGEPLSPWAHSSAVTTIRCFFSFLERQGVILRDPAAAIPLPRIEALPRGVLSEAQARRLMAAPFSVTAIGKRDRAILEALYGSGLRRAELVRCDVADLDLARGLLLIRSGKGRKDRIVPVGGRALLALGAYLDEARPELERQPTPALFLTRYGLRMDVQSVNLRVRWHARVASVQATPHVLRHSCATHLLRGGADVRHVQRLLGHKRVVTTALYTRVAAADLRAVFSRSHPRREVPALGEPVPITYAVLQGALARAHPRRTAGEPVEG